MHAGLQENFDIFELLPVLLLGVIGGLLGSWFTYLNESLAAWRKRGEWAQPSCQVWLACHAGWGCGGVGGAMLMQWAALAADDHSDSVAC